MLTYTSKKIIQSQIIKHFSETPHWSYHWLTNSRVLTTFYFILVHRPHTLCSYITSYRLHFSNALHVHSFRNLSTLFVMHFLYTGEKECTSIKIKIVSQMIFPKSIYKPWSILLFSIHQQSSYKTPWYQDHAPYIMAILHCTSQSLWSFGSSIHDPVNMDIIEVIPVINYPGILKEKLKYFQQWAHSHGRV